MAVVVRGGPDEGEAGGQAVLPLEGGADEGRVVWERGTKGHRLKGGTREGIGGGRTGGDDLAGDAGLAAGPRGVACGLWVCAVEDGGEEVFFGDGHRMVEAAGRALKEWARIEHGTAGGPRRGGGKKKGTHKGTRVDAVEDVASEVVSFEVFDEMADLGVWGREDGAEDGLDLMPSLLDGVDVSFGRTALVAGAWTAGLGPNANGAAGDTYRERCRLG